MSVLSFEFAERRAHRRAMRVVDFEMFQTYRYYWKKYKLRMGEATTEASRAQRDLGYQQFHVNTYLKFDKIKKVAKKVLSDWGY